MKNQIEKQRLVQYAKQYKEALPDQDDDQLIALEKPLPNDAARANGAIRTRTQRYGSSKLSSTGKSTLSTPKK